MTLVNFPKQVVIADNYIGGEFCSPKGRDLLEVHSPYTGAVIGQIPLSTAEDVSQAVSAAEAAFLGWRVTPIKERSQYLFAFREKLLDRLEELANIAACESGKTVAEARAGVLKGIEVVEFALGIQNLDTGGALEVSRGVTCQFRREPLGVVAGIAPFNFPAMVPLWMYPIALALGNCFILKPSEKVPLTSHVIAEIFSEIKLPPGVFSIVNGGRETVEAVVAHPEVKAVAFVGSSAVAQTVYSRASALGKRALCLGGAKNNLIVVPDADHEVAVDGIVSSFTGCAGQRCMAASLVLAVGSVDEVLEAVVERSAKIKLGTGMGAIIDRPALERISNMLDRAQMAGAKIVLDGRLAKPPAGCEGGNWMGPTIIDNASIEMECATAEIFGPVVTIVRTGDLTEALRYEASNCYGNATSVFTTSGAIGERVMREATAGMIGINVGVPVPREPFSFGGTKQSKFGVTDITGESALDFWSSRKKITAKWAIQADHNWMS